MNNFQEPIKNKRIVKTPFYFDGEYDWEEDFEDYQKEEIWHG